MSNNYVDRMFCYYCMKSMNSRNPSELSFYTNNLCSECGKKMFGANTINVYTPTIPPREYYDYNEPKLYGINGRFLPFISPYGSDKGKFVNLS